MKNHPLLLLVIIFSIFGCQGKPVEPDKSDYLQPLLPYSGWSILINYRIQLFRHLHGKWPKDVFDLMSDGKIVATLSGEYKGTVTVFDEHNLSIKFVSSRKYREYGGDVDEATYLVKMLDGEERTLAVQYSGDLRR